MEQPDQRPSPEKKIGPLQWIAVIVVLLILIYLAQKSGCGPVKTEEKLEWIDR